MGYHADSNNRYHGLPRQADLGWGLFKRVSPLHSTHLLAIGLSFDDGPSPDTPRLINYLAEQNLKSTFFLVGSRVISRPQIVQAEYMAGHQL